jgi:tetrahydromethanopterin S-methyltransferase subunit G
MPKRVADSTTQITVRLDDDVLERIDAVSARLTKEFGSTVGRSDVLRAIVARGLVVLERERLNKK